jgi:hypothetical protein
LLCFVRAQEVATFQGGETFTEGVKLRGRLRFAARTDLVCLLQPSDSGVQTSERIFLSLAVLAGDFGGHASAQKANRE